MKTIFGLLLITFMLNFTGYTQLNSIVKLPYQNPDMEAFHSHPLQISNSELVCFYLEKSRLMMIKSSNGGVTWDSPTVIRSSITAYSDLMPNINAIRLNSGRIIVSYRMYTGHNTYMYSDDNGLSWITKTYLRTGTGTTSANSIYAAYSSFYEFPGNLLTYVYSDISSVQSIFYISSTDGGVNWAPRKSIALEITKKKLYDVSFHFQGTSEWVCNFVCFDSLSSKYAVYDTKSSDIGNTWSQPALLYMVNEKITTLKFLRTSESDAYVIYRMITDSVKTTDYNHYNYEIVYRKSSNNGITWSGLIKFTNFPGDDNFPSISRFNDKVAVSFLSERGGLNNFYGKGKLILHFGIIGQTDDNLAPPYLVKSDFVGYYRSKNPFRLEAHLLGDSIQSVVAKITVDKSRKMEVILYDDGLHNDRLPNDGVYGAVLGGMLNPVDKENILLSIKYEASNNRASMETEEIGAYLAYFDIEDYAKFNINKFDIPFDNKGVTAAVTPVGGQSGGRYDGVPVLFGGGFFLSGYSNDQLWSNGVASVSLVTDYVPGNVGSVSKPNGIAVVKSSDPPFGESWKNWKFAVLDGAPFYDGDGDGKYNPVDKNSNGIWDPDEDRPDLIGDFTGWCVYNDGVPAAYRRYNDVPPQGIEIQQTLFGWEAPGHKLENVVFIRYKIENKNNSVEVIDSVYFGLLTDPDIGIYSNDLVGSDTMLMACYSYDKDMDSTIVGVPPSFLTAIIQGPVSFIPGETFTDVNGDGKYTPGVDIPLDTAYNYLGVVRGIETIPGAKNLITTSFLPYITSHPILGDPSNKNEVRNYLIGGRDRFGNYIDPCTWLFGTVYGVPCETVNPIFFYSGDPITKTGWVDTTPLDNRMMANVGPFKLEKNKPVEIITAYVGGRGDSPLNSITVAKENGYAARELYSSNFNFGAVNSPNIKREIISNELGNNYPNPFNPVTTISYRIETPGHVTMKIFDVLGREVSTLVNQVKETGVHRVEFDGSRLASGIYFYELRVNHFREIKKMLLIR